MIFRKARKNGLTVKWAIIVGLVWTQFAFAEHGHDHDHDHDHDYVIADHPDDCGICLQLDSGDSVLAYGTSTHNTFPAALSAEWTGDLIESTEPFPHYSARASP